MTRSTLVFAFAEDANGSDHAGERVRFAQRHANGANADIYGEGGIRRQLGGAFHHLATPLGERGPDGLGHGDIVHRIGEGVTACRRAKVAAQLQIKEQLLREGSFVGQIANDALDAQSLQKNRIHQGWFHRLGSRARVSALRRPLPLGPPSG